MTPNLLAIAVSVGEALDYATSNVES